jgi:hypothetical protein
VPSARQSRYRWWSALGPTISHFNLTVVVCGDVVIAVGGAWGTLSEIALARNVDREVILLDTWTMEPPEGGELDGVRRARTPAEAVQMALASG